MRRIALNLLVLLLLAAGVTTAQAVASPSPASASTCSWTRRGPFWQLHLASTVTGESKAACLDQEDTVGNNVPRLRACGSSPGQRWKRVPWQSRYVSADGGECAGLGKQIMFVLTLTTGFTPSCGAGERTGSYSAAGGCLRGGTA